MAGSKIQPPGVLRLKRYFYNVWAEHLPKVAGMRSWNCSLLTALVLAAGCSTAPIPTFDPILVPPGMTKSQVEVAILAALANTPVPKELSEGADLADRAMAAYFGPLRYQSARSSRNQEWYPEYREPGLILAGLNIRSHYLQMRLEYDDSKIRPSIGASRNLKQTDTRIHENAVEWAHRLLDRISRSVGYMSAYVVRTETR